MWTLHVLCVALEAQQLWKSSMTPRCWSACPSWTRVFTLCCRSQTVSAAPGSCQGCWQTGSRGGLWDTLGRAPEPAPPSRAAEELRVCSSTTKLVHLQVFLGAEHVLEWKGWGRRYTWGLLWMCIMGTWPGTSLGMKKPSSPWEAVLGPGS